MKKKKNYFQLEILHKNRLVSSSIPIDFAIISFSCFFFFSFSYPFINVYHADSCGHPLSNIYLSLPFPYTIQPHFLPSRHVYITYCLSTLLTCGLLKKKDRNGDILLSQPIAPTVLSSSSFCFWVCLGD